MDKIKDLLGEEIRSQLGSLTSLQAGSKEKSDAIDDVTQLYRLYIEESKNEADLLERRQKREMDGKQLEADLVERREKRKLEIKQLEAEIARSDRDNDIKKDQLAEQIKDRYFRVGIAVAELVLPLIFYAFWMKKGFNFEETGTYTSTTFRGLFSRFRPTK